MPRRLLALLALVLVAGCAPSGLEPNPPYEPQRAPWGELDQQGGEPQAGHPVPGVDGAPPKVEGGEPVGPDELRFILSLYDNHGRWVDLGDQGYAATVTISGLTADRQPVVVNGVPFAVMVTRVVPYAFRIDKFPEVVTVELFATIGIPSGWKIRCDVEVGGVPYGIPMVGTSPGESGFHVAEVLCTWAG